MDIREIFTEEELDEEFDTWEESLEAAIDELIDRGLVIRVYIDGEEGIKITEAGLEVINNIKKGMH